MAENRSHGGAGDTMGATRPQAYHAGISTFMRRPMLDVVEVAPNYDPAETTIRLAAQALFQFLVERAPESGRR